MLNPMPKANAAVANSNSSRGEVLIRARIFMIVFYQGERVKKVRSSEFGVRKKSGYYFLSL